MCILSSFTYRTTDSLQWLKEGSLPSPDMRSKGVEVTALDIVEQHLNRGHVEVVGTQVEDRESPRQCKTGGRSLSRVRTSSST